MRKLRVFSIILSLIILSGLSNEIVAKDCSVIADTVIVINPFPIPGNDIPRSPALVPISAQYMSLLSTVILTFTSNLGEIEVEITNTTSGGYASGTIDTQYLSSIIPISMGPGHYILLFTLPSGRQYIGEFDI